MGGGGHDEDPDGCSTPASRGHTSPTGTCELVLSDGCRRISAGEVRRLSTSAEFSASADRGGIRVWLELRKSVHPVPGFDKSQAEIEVSMRDFARLWRVWSAPCSLTEDIS